MLFYFDESIRNPFFGLGCIAFEFKDFGNIYNSIKQLKNDLGIDFLTPIKYTLGDNNNKERKAKETLRDKLGNRWEYLYRKQVAHKISDLPLSFTASLHEDIRKSKLKKASCLDFYCKAFEWLLPRCYGLSETFKSYQENIVVIDRPPETDYSLNLEKINLVYITSYNRYTSSLQCINFIDHLVVASTDSSIALQIVDFYIGALVDFLKYCQNRRHKESTEYINILKNRFYPFGDYDSIKGIKTYALSSEMYQAVYEEMYGSL